MQSGNFIKGKKKNSRFSLMESLWSKIKAVEIDIIILTKNQIRFCGQIGSFDFAQEK